MRLRFFRLIIIALFPLILISCDLFEPGFFIGRGRFMAANIFGAGELVTNNEGKDQYSSLRFEIRGTHEGGNIEGGWEFEIHMFVYIDVYKNTEYEGKLSGYYSGEIYYEYFMVDVLKMKDGLDNPRRDNTIYYMSESQELPYYYTNPGPYCIEVEGEGNKIDSIKGVQPVISVLPIRMKIGFIGQEYPNSTLLTTRINIIDRSDKVISTVFCQGNVIKFSNGESFYNWRNLNPLKNYLEYPEDIPIYYENL